MKQLIPFLLFIFLTFQVQAQAGLVVGPNPYIETFLVDFSNPNAQAIAQGYFINTSGKTMNVKWELVVPSTDCPKEWGYQVCDKNDSYKYGSASKIGGPVGVPVKLAPGDTSMLELHLKPNAVSGCCRPSIQLRSVDDPANILATAGYDVCVEKDTNASRRKETALRVFPNPATNYLSLTDNDRIKKIWISNILGKRVKSFSTLNGSRYDVADLPDGIYLVSMVDEYNKVVKTVRISKRNIRP